MTSNNTTERFHKKEMDTTKDQMERQQSKTVIGGLLTGWNTSLGFEETVGADGNRMIAGGHACGFGEKS